MSVFSLPGADLLDKCKKYHEASYKNEEVPIEDLERLVKDSNNRLLVISGRMDIFYGMQKNPILVEEKSEESLLAD